MGEAEFGLLDGVVATQALWLGSAEGVRVTYDPQRLPFDRLLQHARASECDRTIWTTTDAQLALVKEFNIKGIPHRDIPNTPRPSEKPDEEPKYYLRRSPLQHVPMTPLQQARINALFHNGTPAVNSEADRAWRALLSPAQHAMLDRARTDQDQEFPSALDVPLRQAWTAFPSNN